MNKAENKGQGNLRVRKNSRQLAGMVQASQERGGIGRKVKPT